MTRITPFDEMERLFEQMRRSMFDGPFAVDHGSATSSANMRLGTDDDGYVVYADLPGFETEEIDLWFDDGVLRIEALHETEDDAGFRSRHISEELRVPGEIDVDAIDADYHNGVLEVRLPSTSDVEPSGHRIDID